MTDHRYKEMAESLGFWWLRCMGFDANLKASLEVYESVKV